MQLPNNALGAFLGVRNQNERAGFEEGMGIAKLQLAQKAQEQASLDRREAIDATREARRASLVAAGEARQDRLQQFNESLEMRKQQAQQAYDLRVQGMTDARARDAATAEFRQQQQVFQQHQASVNEELRRLGVQLQRDKLEMGGLSGEAAGKVAMADQAVVDIRDTRGLLFGTDGKLKREIIASMNVPFTAGLPGHAEARSAYSKLHNAVAAKLRIETGAAATESEVKGILDRFLPKVSDPESVVKERLDRLEEFMNTTIDQTKGVRHDALRSRSGKPPAAPAAPPSGGGWSIKPL